MDKEALRFQAFTADRILTRLNLVPSEKLLDVLTGTGLLVVSAAQALSGGRVTAIDTAEALLEKLEGKIRQFGIANIDVQNMPAQRLDFRRDYFDHVVCSFGLSWCLEPHTALREWWRVLRPGGRVVIAEFTRAAFAPYVELLQRQLDEQHATHNALPWETWVDEAAWRALLEQAGFADVEVRRETIRYRLPDAQLWWEVVQYSGLWRLLAGLNQATRARLKAGHLADITHHLTDDGLPLQVEVWLVEGRKR